MNLRLICILTVMAASAPAQGPEFVLRDGSRIGTGLSSYDDARQRLVQVGRQGETREFDGATYLQRPGIGPRLIGSMVYRSVAQRTMAYGLVLDDATLAFETGTWEYDGFEWQEIPSAALPATTHAQAMAYDRARDRVVLFGGSTQSGTLSGETFEWDGASWTVRATSGPPGRAQPTMTYDANRGVCVMFGGQISGTGPVDEHWEWDGTNWTRRTFAQSPPARRSAMMGFDRARNVTVLYGGVGITTGATDELWEFDGTNWQQVPYTTGTGPGQRLEGDMVFDSGSGTMLVIPALYAGQQQEVWSWDGAAWQLVTSKPAVATQSVYSRCAADPIGGGALLFGSLFGSATWFYANGAWSWIGPQGPTARIEPTLWSDGTQTWMFGGVGNFASTALDETWRWNGSAWQLLATASAPSPRGNASAAYDSMRGETVLFGGTSVWSPADTWTFDGSNWQQRNPANMPPARRDPGMAYDSVRDRIVMFGGTGVFGPRNDTWEWHGATANWMQVTTAQSPPAFNSAAMIFDPTTNRILMTQARETSSLTSTISQAWSYDGSNWTSIPLQNPPVVDDKHALIREPSTGAILIVDSTAVFELVDQPARVKQLGAGCGTPAPMLAARDQPTVGNALFGLDVLTDAGNSPVVIGASDNTVQQQVLGCTVYLGAPLVTVTDTTNGAGFLTRDLLLPNQPTLLGTTWHFQAISLQAAAPMGIAFSPGLGIVIGTP